MTNDFSIKKVAYFYGKYIVLMENGKVGVVESDGISINYINIDDKVQDFCVTLQSMCMLIFMIIQCG